MACKRLRIFTITSIGSDGFPVAGEPVPLVTPGSDGKDHNLVSMSITPEFNSAPFEADDDFEETKVIKRETVTISAFGVEIAALVALGLATKDANGNLIISQSNTKRVILFAEGAYQKGPGKNFWLYQAVAQPLDQKVTTQLKGASTDPLTITFYNYPLTTKEFGEIPHLEVYEGNQGYINATDEITSAKVYKGATTATGSGS